MTKEQFIEKMVKDIQDEPLKVVYKTLIELTWKVAYNEGYEACKKSNLTFIQGDAGYSPKNEEK